MNNSQNFYDIVQAALETDCIESKEQLVLKALEHCNKNCITANEGFTPKLFTAPSYASICQIVSPKELPVRKNFDTTEGLTTLVHAIAHIEFSAVDLAIDAAYRFPDMPLDYKRDWLVVAQDEIRHFKMLNQILKALGANYGDLPVHQGLFDASMHTTSDVLDRMAVIPRHYEAGGLDVNPQIIKKLENRAKNSIVASVIEALQVIEIEEIDHVKKGDKWFKWICKNRNLEPTNTFHKILKNYNLLRHKPHINVKSRKKAGFSCDELLLLGATKCD